MSKTKTETQDLQDQYWKSMTEMDYDKEKVIVAHGKQKHHTMFNNSSISAVTVNHCSVSNLGSCTQHFKSTSLHGRKSPDQDRDQDSRVPRPRLRRSRPRPRPRLVETGLETSREQDSSLLNCKSGVVCVLQSTITATRRRCSTVTFYRTSFPSRRR